MVGQWCHVLRPEWSSQCKLAGERWEESALTVPTFEHILFRELAIPEHREGKCVRGRSNRLHQIARQGRAVGIVRVEEPECRIQARPEEGNGRLGFEDSVQVIEHRVGRVDGLPG